MDETHKVNCINILESLKNANPPHRCNQISAYALGLIYTTTTPLEYMQKDIFLSCSTVGRNYVILSEMGTNNINDDTTCGIYLQNVTR